MNPETDEEQVDLKRRPNRPDSAVTWEDRVLGIVRADAVPQTVRAAAGDLVDGFIAAHQAADESMPAPAADLKE